MPGPGAESNYFRDVEDGDNKGKPQCCFCAMILNGDSSAKTKRRHLARHCDKINETTKAVMEQLVRKKDDKCKWSFFKLFTCVLCNSNRAAPIGGAGSGHATTPSSSATPRCKCVLVFPHFRVLFASTSRFLHCLLLVVLYVGPQRPQVGSQQPEPG